MARRQVLDTPISEVRDNPPHGVNYVVDIEVRGIGAKADRAVTVRTVSDDDNYGQMLDLVSETEDRLKLITKHS